MDEALIWALVDACGGDHDDAVRAAALADMHLPGSGALAALVQAGHVLAGTVEPDMAAAVGTDRHMAAVVLRSLAVRLDELAERLMEDTSATRVADWASATVSVTRLTGNLLDRQGVVCHTVPPPTDTRRTHGTDAEGSRGDRADGTGRSQ